MVLTIMMTPWNLVYSAVGAPWMTGS